MRKVNEIARNQLCLYSFNLWVSLLMLKFILIKYASFIPFVLVLLENSFAARRKNKEWLNLRKPWFIFVLFMTLFGDVNCYHINVLDDRQWKSLISCVHFTITFHFSSQMFDSPQNFYSTWKPILILYDLYIYSCFQQVSAIHRWFSLLFLSIMRRQNNLPC